MDFAHGFEYLWVFILDKFLELELWIKRKIFVKFFTFYIAINQLHVEMPVILIKKLSVVSELPGKMQYPTTILTFTSGIYFSTICVC